MAPLIFIALIVIPAAELYVIIQVAQEIGLIETLLVLFVVAIAGTWLLKQQGMAAWARLRQTLEQGRMPTTEVTDGALIMLGGAFLLTPGFLTDVFGLLLLFPPTRAVIKVVSRKAMRRWTEKRIGAVGRAQVREARVVKVERGRTGATPPESRRSSSALPGDAAASPEDDSPGTG